MKQQLIDLNIQKFEQKSFIEACHKDHRMKYYFYYYLEEKIPSVCYFVDYTNPNEKDQEFFLHDYKLIIVPEADMDRKRINLSLIPTNSKKIDTLERRKIVKAISIAITDLKKQGFESFSIKTEGNGIKIDENSDNIGQQLGLKKLSFANGFCMYSGKDHSLGK